MASETQTAAVGQRIRTLRRRAEMTIEELAHAADVHPNHIGEVERGKRNPSVDVLLRIAHALEVSPSTLLDGYEGASRAALLKLIKTRLTSLDDDELRSLLRILDAIRR